MSKHQQSSMGKSGKSKQQHKHYFLFLMARFLFSGFLIPGGQGRWWYCDYDYDYDPLICFLLHVAINMLFYPSWRPAHPTYPVPLPLSTSTNRTPKQQVPYHTKPYHTIHMPESMPEWAWQVGRILSVICPYELPVGRAPEFS